eukprot:7736947-Pyramimonas_sp.AAC.1
MPRHSACGRLPLELGTFGSCAARGWAHWNSGVVSRSQPRCPTLCASRFVEFGQHSVIVATRGSGPKQGFHYSGRTREGDDVEELVRSVRKPRPVPSRSPQFEDDDAFVIHARTG